MSKQTPKQQSLCNNKFDGLMNAAPHKRYKSFAVTVADWESVWLDCDPNQPLPDEGVISVWPEEMFAAAVCTDKPFFKMDVHDFCDLLGAHPDATIRVFPNGKNWTDVAGGGGACRERGSSLAIDERKFDQPAGSDVTFAGGRAGRARPGGVRAWRMDDWFAGRM